MEKQWLIVPKSGEATIFKGQNLPDNRLSEIRTNQAQCFQIESSNVKIAQLDESGSTRELVASGQR